MNKEISRKRLVHGDVLEIEIDNFGFAYFKYINVQKINPDSSYPDLIRIYKNLYEHPINNLESLDRELLVAPKLISGRSGIFKALKIRIVANENVFEEEKIMPDVKIGYPDHLYGFEEEKYEKWKVKKDMGDSIKSYFTTLDKVRHLEWAGAMNITVIPFRIKLELLKLQGKDIKLEYGLQDWHEEFIYLQSINLPVYSLLNPETRDFAYE